MSGLALCGGVLGAAIAAYAARTILNGQRKAKILNSAFIANALISIAGCFSSIGSIPAGYFKGSRFYEDFKLRGEARGGSTTERVQNGTNLNRDIAINATTFLCLPFYINFRGFSADSLYSAQAKIGSLKRGERFPSAAGNSRFATAPSLASIDTVCAKAAATTALFYYLENRITLNAARKPSLNCEAARDAFVL